VNRTGIDRASDRHLPIVDSRPRDGVGNVSMIVEDPSQHVVKGAQR